MKTDMRVKCTGAWVKGELVRVGCGWAWPVIEPPRPKHLVKPGGMPRNHWTSCPKCGGSIVFFRVGPLILIREWAAGLVSR